MTNARQIPGGGGGRWARLELTEPLVFRLLFLFNKLTTNYLFDFVQNVSLDPAGVADR